MMVPFAFVTDRNVLEWLDFPALLLWLIVSLGAYLYVARFAPGFLARPIVWFLTHTLYLFRSTGIENVPKSGPAILVANHLSFIDWLFVAAACPRTVFVSPTADDKRLWLARFILGWARRVDAPHQIQNAINNGQVVLIFGEGRLSRIGYLQSFESELDSLPAVPIVPVGIVNNWGSIFSYALGKIIWKWPQSFPRRIGVAFGPALPAGTKAPEIRQHVERAMAEAAKKTNHWGKPVHRQFVRMAARRPLRSCYVDPVNNRELNFGKALAGAWCLRNWLQPRLGPEQMIGLWLPTSVGGAVANIACTFLGKVTVNLNYTASPESVASAIAQTGLKQVLTSKVFVRKCPTTFPAHEAPAADGKVQIIYLEDALHEINNRQRFFAFLKVLLLPGWLLEYVMLGLGKHQLDDLMTIIFSSGSTGEPKGIMLSHRNISTNIDSVVAAIDLNRNDRALGSLPFFHSFGFTIMLWGPPTTGASVVYYPDPRAAKEIGELCKQHRCNLMISTATFLRFYLKRCEVDDFKSLRILVCGAEKLPVSLAEEFRDKFGILPLEGYGCTELSPTLSANVPEREIDGIKPVTNKPGTVGRPLIGTAAKIVDPDTYEEVAVGREGLILAYGANVMLGYLGKPEKSAEVVRDGWYVTGDIGHVDADGFITLTGRLSRFAKVGGEMVPLEMLEDEMHAAIGISDRVLAVTSVPDKARGERIIVLHVKSGSVEPRQVIQKLGERNIPNLWIPKDRDFSAVDELPLLGTGKLDLRRLKSMALELNPPR